MKKVILSLLLAVLLISPSGFGVGTANAQLSTEADAQLIAQLRLQIQALKLQISQLTAAQSQTNVTLAALARVMAQGTSGDDVKILQALLAADANVYAEGLITGFFGPATARAVAKFQAKHGLAATGRVDAATLAALRVELAERALGLEVDASTGIRRPCAAVPPGHLIAPGWLRRHAGVRPIVPTCQILPPGISAKIEGAAGVSAVTTASISANSATVNFMTSVAATGKVYYSTSSPVNTSTALSVSGNAGATTHSVTLVNLQANTTYYFVVEARDASGNVSTSATFSFTTSASGSADTTAPVIASVAAAVTANSALINWTTNESATGKVYYSTTTPVNLSTSSSATGSSNLTTHAVNLLGLSANTRYYIVVESRDGSNNVSTSSEFQFTTLVQ